MKPQGTRTIRTITVSLLLCAVLAFTASCGSQQGATSASSASSQSASAGSASNAPQPEEYNKALEPEGLVSTFIGEKFYDQKITNEEEALAAVKSVYDRIGADDTTDLKITAIRPTETGTTYYVFNQKAGDVLVYGASVKVITDSDGMATGLVSAILPGVELAKAEDWEISSEQAEQLVVKECEESGHPGVKPVEGATEQTLITVPNHDNRFQYAWVVYTANYDADSEMAYLAHYVDATGVYLYAIPISEPHNADAAAGDKANFDFEKYEQSSWSGEVTLHDGTTKQIEVPVLVDTSDNTQILADGKRKILCADFAEWSYQETLQPRTSIDASFDNIELLVYDSFIKVWDFYDSIGWTAPDGDNTPTLLLMDYVNKDGIPEDNAFYLGRQNGFQAFTFNNLNPDGENIDVVAHEFTHCVTTTTMTTNVYKNDMGAINEGMSDVLGNLVEMLVENNPESTWLMASDSGAETLRIMKDPHASQQPAFKWDAYYAPNVSTGTQVNDFGGAHANASLLNIVSYKLDQAGMSPSDQVYFWMNVALAMTPHTDFNQLAQLLPWCMEQSDYPQYTDALNTAIDEAGYTISEQPAAPPAGTGRVSIDYNTPDIIDKGLVRFDFTSTENGASAATWPAADTRKTDLVLPAGDYRCIASIGAEYVAGCTEYAYADGSWKASDGDTEIASIIHVEEGETLMLSAQGLPQALDEIG